MKEKQIEEWISKAEEDYRASLSLNAKDVPNIICYHSHQCIEKYLKAFLILKEEKPPWIHDLIRLCELAKRHDEHLGSFDDLLQKLNPYGILTRYPGWSASAKDVEIAVSTMKELRGKLKNILGLEK
ncbi:MAG: HEPN domain-containing protein [Candidatus Methanofastidiosia archaeon]